MYRPKYVAVLLIAMTIGNINFDISGVPLNLRAIISISLLGRILIGKSQAYYYSFFKTIYSTLIIVFFLYTIMSTYWNDLLDFDLIKNFVMTYLSAYFAYYYFFYNNDSSILLSGLVIAGLICLADLIYTYKVIGTFPPVHRIIDIYTGKAQTLEDTDQNHNFYGYVCGVCFVFLFNEYMQGRLKFKLYWLAMPLMLLGVIMSTSRAAISVVVIVVLWILYQSYRSSKEGARRVFKLVSMLLLAVSLSVFFYGTVKAIFKVNSDIMETLTDRLIDEPVAVVQKNLGMNYDASVLGAMEWRKDANEIAYDTYQSLLPIEQIFGIGTGGFTVRDYGHGYNVHNGYFLLLIEGGAVGFLIYFTLIIILLSNIAKQKRISSAYMALLFILLFTVTHNSEMVSATAFFMVGCIAGEIIGYNNRHKPLPDEQE